MVCSSFVKKFNSKTHYKLILRSKSVIFDLWLVECFSVAELLGSVEEVYAQKHSQSDLGVAADQYRCRPMSSVWLFANTLCPKISILSIFDCNLKTNYQILIIFGTNISNITCHQVTIQFPTSPYVCFCTTWGKHN